MSSKQQHKVGVNKNPLMMRHLRLEGAGCTIMLCCFCCADQIKSDQPYQSVTCNKNYSFQYRYREGVKLEMVYENV
ncbi:MAG: hypothetical protein V7722_02780 [Porticoccus sp.]